MVQAQQKEKLNLTASQTFDKIHSFPQCYIQIQKWYNLCPSVIIFDGVNEYEANTLKFLRRKLSQAC